MNSTRQFARHGKKIINSRTVMQAVGGSIVAGGVYAAIKYDDKNADVLKSIQQKNAFPQTVSCATNQLEQPSVISDTKNHALYLTIHLNPDAKADEIAKALFQLENIIDKICPPDLRDEDDEIVAGLGFGPNFLRRIYPEGYEKGIENFSYEHRKGGEADMPSTGGDIFIHAKCHERGKLFELAKAVKNNMPKNSIKSLEDIYGWVYQGGRDLSGFIDGTENPAEEDERREVAINGKTGGSYVIAQKWIHKHDVIDNTEDGEMSKWIGRTRNDSTALKPKAPSSHVARTTGCVDGSFKKHKIVRQSQPYGTISGDNGLFFIAYAKSPEPFNYMLDQMAGSTKDGLYDHVFKLTDCVTGSYFYFPSMKELKAMLNGSGASPSKKGFW